MDFVAGLPRDMKKFDAAWVIVEQLTKFAHFIPIVTTYSSERLAEIYIHKMCRSPVDWFDPGKARLLGTNLVQDALKKFKLIQDRLRTAQSRQESYAYQKKYYGDSSHVLNFSTVQLDGNLTYEVEPVAILDRQVRKLRSKNIASVKVQWRGQAVEEAT
ncbi:uncharacterized protein [Nicotiana tomentosiformis]|uniref:uncharacterized protein n=1 Tax=Nicotiana tomentosiformis TaxID=4098 RepID=UPI00388CD50C